jgi:hypothetical protein
MASKRAIRRRACERKVAHKSAAAAHGAVLGHLETFGELLGYYHCPWCGQWHIGHNKNNADNRTLKLS